MPKPKRILVTGGAGFIGSHLCERLLDMGHEVICVDSYFSGSKKNVVKWKDHPRFEMIRHDVCLPLVLEVDEIYHLACPASPVHYQHNAIHTIKTNVMGTLNVCGMAKRVGAKVLLASTSEVYGDPEIHPQVEDYNGNVSCVGRRSCYDEGKRCAESLMMEYYRQHNLRIRIARIFNTYGPRMLFHDGRVVSNFIVQALRGESLTVYGKGDQTRSFCFVSDLVNGLISLMEGEFIGPCNIGNPVEFTILQLAEMVRKKVQEDGGPKIDIIYRTLPKDDPTRRQPDISRAKKYLKWEPKVMLEDGLSKTIADFKQRAKEEPELLFCVHQVEAKPITLEDTTLTPTNGDVAASVGQMVG
uniref:UDP-glucuronate decarboxylase n=1 Tax=Chromera velia CCMP2878 TaxID=1169474 RepID=A0A0G4H804_9ALVE|mmetsp:Transcript_21584/g.42901  ORF Transcript_21584/g.42901 Transcript_21584/m.42901 type:complete len:357 (+) Transcript_21584:155-1225(+)|eukprot:Cvel_25053.t1-p1 / transcript=Cvel_25053.t1 / gene=Cvel_25053 / organism=Chromera_velia_CCMP2878 / gene_product=UDP-glucuronic acid decarboxylase 3, putative / transcript_product=UDP-glucuronic acid decarboxylase 3, putative / location=Cvel_scaffold2786:107-6138(-) / protein_length=356 / sequence_SO=supercontig / SO=protein_coding / is_pseudo=false